MRPTHAAGAHVSRELFVSSGAPSAATSTGVPNRSGKARRYQGEVIRDVLVRADLTYPDQDQVVIRELWLASVRVSRPLYVIDRGAYGHDADVLVVSARPTRSTRLAG